MHSVHSYSSDYLLSKSSYDIATENTEYKHAVNNINKFLNTANSGNPVNFRYGGVDSNKELLDKYWEYTKEIGIYGNYGASPEQKVDFYNNDPLCKWNVYTEIFSQISMKQKKIQQ
nr:hypothetical protein [Mycoplasmopsis bovis]